jgi:hypothetical protein
VLPRIWSPTNVGRTHVLPHALLMGKRCTFHELYLAQHLPHASLGGGVAPQLLHMVQQAYVTVSEEHQLPALPVGRHLGGQPALGKLKKTSVMASELRPNLWRFTNAQLRPMKGARELVTRTIAY